MNKEITHKKTKYFSKFTHEVVLVSMVLAIALGGVSGDVLAAPLLAELPVVLGTSDVYAILAGSGMTNTGVTTISGDIGSSPTSTQTGFAICGTGNCVILTGTNHTAADPNDAQTVAAKVALRTAYLEAQGRSNTGVISADLGGQTLLPGVYQDNGAPASLSITGTLTLDAQGDPNAVWIFQSGSTLTAQTGSIVRLINGAQACNVYWQVGSSATLMTGATFVGNILAYASISLQDSVTVTGRLLAGAQATNGAGAVTLIHDTINVPICSAAVTTTLSANTIIAGGTVHDRTTLIGATSDAGGTITYNYYTDSTCSTGGTTVGSPITVTNGIPASDSADVTFPTAGTYYWQASYSGDTKNLLSTSACISETLIVTSAEKITPTISTTLSATSVLAGSSVFDNTTLIFSLGEADPSGTVIYTIYTNEFCNLGARDAGTKDVSGTAGAPIIPVSNLISFPAPGTYYWQAVYSGDDNYNGAISVCTSEVLTVTAPPVPTPTPKTLPGTGFAPGVKSFLPIQPADKAYTSLGDLWLEIPRLGLQAPIMGVPPTANSWDVTWLSTQIGWLQGSAFPTWAGNSVLTAHVYDVNGNPGPFGNLNTLRYGDQIIVHAFGQQYIYEVQSTSTVSPNAVASVIKHEELPWLSLLTCQGYNEKTNSYKNRYLVRAIQVEID